MAYLDPPFNTGNEQRRGELWLRRPFEDYAGFLAPRLRARARLLAAARHALPPPRHREAIASRSTSTRSSGASASSTRSCGPTTTGPAQRRWPAKHDTILVYVKDPGAYHFDDAEVERKPYMAPGLVGPEKAARGKRLTRQVVSHHRPDERAREDRLPDPEAGRRRAPHGGRLVTPGRLVPGLLRRVRDARRGRPRAGAALRARRLPCRRDCGLERTSRAAAPLGLDPMEGSIRRWW